MPATLEPGDIIFLEDGREALVTARVEARPGPFEALHQVVVGDSARLELEQVEGE